MKSIVTASMVTVILVSMLILVLGVRSVAASGTICIRAAGSIDPRTANITTADNVTHPFSDSVCDTGANTGNHPLVGPGTPTPVEWIDVPFHYQSADYWCGPACLEMVFDYYGEDVSQLEIAEVARTYPYTTYADELRRAAHFSNVSLSGGTEMVENITGYSLRQHGYAAFEQWSMTIDQLKALIDNDSPVILLMWYSPLHVSTHYRVAVGYNSTHIILHDPWNNIEWGGAYGGPNLAFDYSTFLDLWQYFGNWALFTCPWHVTIDAPSNVQQGDTFTVTANTTYPCPAPFPTSDYPASLCSVTIALPTGLTLAPNETATKTLGTISPGSSTLSDWVVKAEACGTYNLTVEAGGEVAGSVWAHEIFSSYDYEDRVGAKSEVAMEVLDIDPPSVSILSPEAKTYGARSVPLVFSVSEPISWIGYSLNGQSNTTIADNTTLQGLSDGSYHVVVYANDTFGNMGASDAVYFTVDTVSPLADAGADQAVAEDTPVVFDGSASSDNLGIAAYEWTFMDETAMILTGQEPTYTFNTPSVYTVTLNVTDAAGQWDTDTVTITVLDATKPVADFAQDGIHGLPEKRTIVPLDASLSTDNVGIVSYTWDFGDGSTGTGMTPTHIYASTGNYTVTLTVRDAAGNQDTTSMNIWIPAEEIPLLWIVAVAIAAAALSIAGVYYFLKRRKTTASARDT